MTDATFFGEGLRSPERPRATRVSGRTERSISLYTGGTPELTNLPFVPGNRGPETKLVSGELEALVDAGTWYVQSGGAFVGDVATTVQNNATWLAVTAALLWVPNQIKKAWNFIGRKLSGDGDRY